MLEICSVRKHRFDFLTAADGNNGTGCSLQVWMKQENTAAFLARKLEVFVVFSLVATSITLL